MKRRLPRSHWWLAALLILTPAIWYCIQSSHAEPVQTYQTQPLSDQESVPMMPPLHQPILPIIQVAPPVAMLGR